MKPSAIQFGGYLKTLRKRKNLTVRELAEKTDVSHSYLTQIENGKRGVPSHEILTRLAKPLGVSVDELMIQAGYINLLSYSYQPVIHELEGSPPSYENVCALFVLGVNIKRLREKMGKTAIELAKELDISLEYLEHIEVGKRELSTETIEKFARYFNTDYYYLIYDKTNFTYEDHGNFGNIARWSLINNNRDIKEIDTQPSKIISIQDRSITTESSDDEIVKIPIYGTIKAGYDYVAEQSIVGYTFASKKEVSDGEYFYLLVKGDSMIDEGIKEGFKVLVKRQTFVENGKVGVVIVNGDEATLKRVFYDGANVILQASNKDIPPRVLPLQDVMIQGQVKSVVFDL